MSTAISTPAAVTITEARATNDMRPPAFWVEAAVTPVRRPRLAAATLALSSAPDGFGMRTWWIGNHGTVRGVVTVLRTRACGVAAATWRTPGGRGVNACAVRSITI